MNGSGFMEYMQAGGSIMWVIFVLSVIACGVVIERVVFMLGASGDAEAVESAFGRAVAEGDLAGARAAATGRTSVHRLFTAAYTHWMIDGDNLKLLMEQQIRRELYRWERGMSLLDVIARVSPLLGLLGTVLGMVEMFQNLNLGGSVNAQTVTGGIWKALFTTVAGLTVAIPVIVAHGILSGRIDKEEEKLERGADFLLREHFRTTSGEEA